MPSVSVAAEDQQVSVPGDHPPPPGADGRYLLERAKGALMMRYGIDSYQALAVLVHWSRQARTPLSLVAHTLVHGICEGNPQTAARERALARWLEQQLRHHDVDLVRSTSPPVDARPVTSAVGGRGHPGGHRGTGRSVTRGVGAPARARSGRSGA